MTGKAPVPGWVLKELDRLNEALHAGRLSADYHWREVGSLQARATQGLKLGTLDPMPFSNARNLNNDAQRDQGPASVQAALRDLRRSLAAQEWPSVARTFDRLTDLAVWFGPKRKWARSGRHRIEVFDDFHAVFVPRGKVFEDYTEDWLTRTHRKYRRVTDEHGKQDFFLYAHGEWRPLDVKATRGVNFSLEHESSLDQPGWGQTMPDGSLILLYSVTGQAVQVFLMDLDVLRAARDAGKLGQPQRNTDRSNGGSFYPVDLTRWQNAATDITTQVFAQVE